MSYKSVYLSEDEIPEVSLKDLYKMDDVTGQYKFVGGIEGLPTKDDIIKLQTAIANERNFSKALKTKYKSVLGDDEPEKIAEKLSRIQELEILAEGKVDESKVNDLVETRLKSRLTPLERDLQASKEKERQLLDALEEYKRREARSKICDEVRKAAVKHKVLETAIEDILELSEKHFTLGQDDSVLSKDGYSPDFWIQEMQSKRPHWWGASVGGGAKGSMGSVGISQPNPWKLETFNITEQMKITKADPQKADQLKRQAGVK